MNEPWHLLAGYFDGELIPEQEHQLRDWLIADADHVRTFVIEAHFHNRIRVEVRASKELIAVRETEEPETGVVRAAGLEASSPTSVTAFPIPSVGKRRRTVTTVLALAACVSLIVGRGVWCLLPASNQPILMAEKGGRAFLDRDGRESTVDQPTILQPLDFVRTPGTNGVSIRYGDEKTRVELDKTTELKIMPWKMGKHLELQRGAVTATVAKQRAFRPMVVTTPTAETRVVGTRFSMTVSATLTRLDVIEGKVKFIRKGDGASVYVAAGYHSIAAAGYPLSALPRTGRMLREVWRNIGGGEVHDLTLHRRFPGRPDARDFPHKFETVDDTNSTFGMRLRGYLIPEEADDYSFIVSGNGAVALSLSEDESPESRFRIAQTSAGTRSGVAPRPGFISTQRQSAPVKLYAGRAYYFEVIYIHAAGQGTPELSIAWSRPGQDVVEISPELIAPFKSGE